jgi:hypothetical protein
LHVTVRPALQMPGVFKPGVMFAFSKGIYVGFSCRQVVLWRFAWLHQRAGLYEKLDMYHKEVYTHTWPNPE